MLWYQGIQNDSLTIEKPRKKQFVCSNCGNRYKHKHHLKRHIEVECGKEPKFRCPYCRHRTKYKESLIKHVYALHPENSTTINSDVKNLMNFNDAKEDDYFHLMP